MTLDKGMSDFKYLSPLGRPKNIAMKFDYVQRAINVFVNYKDPR